MPRTMKDRVRELTPRHREIVRLVSLGCNSSDIATILDLKPNSDQANARRSPQVRFQTIKSIRRDRILALHTRPYDADENLINVKGYEWK